MADVLNRTTLQYLQSVNTPEFPVVDWVINPDLSGVAGVPQKYWKLTGDVVSEMTQPEKDAVDAALAAAVLLTTAQEQQVGEFSMAGTAYATVLELAPTNTFVAGEYQISWSASVKRQSNRGLVSLQLLVDSTPVFELQDINPQKWVHQSGVLQTTWDENTHSVELQVASSVSGQEVFMKNAVLTATRRVS